MPAIGGPGVTPVGETAPGGDLVLVHGWGMGPHVWDDISGALAADRRVRCVELPGHGTAPPAAPDLDSWADQVLAAVDGPADWVGWSLGGLVALAAARRRPALVRSLLLVATNPCFVTAADWPGIDAAVLDGFHRAVAGDPAGTHARFLGFQVAGSERGRSALRRLRASAECDGIPSTAALTDGLTLLRDSDCRTDLLTTQAPVAVMLGGEDPLVPTALVHELGAAGVPVRVLDGAGHAPFLSHPERFVEVSCTLLEGQRCPQPSSGEDH